MTEVSLPKAYSPRDAEPRLYKHWEEAGYFSASVREDKQPYSIVIPPPNITGRLHLGHALNNTIQDILIRWKRMLGYEACWVPGTDHAGIATQNVVEKTLAKENLTRHDLGRQKFVERVWKWKEEYGNTIVRQLRELGVSCDWTRERFTMDEGLSRAVKEVFVRLFDKGLIYRGKYIVNWCPFHQTALSDDEVEHKEQEGKLWYVRYPIEGTTEFAVVATTRPETMFGDTAVAAHPEDERYKHLIGKYVILPLVGKRIPVIADEYIDPSFGTGMLKVTPAHDPNDFLIGERHTLETVNVFDVKGFTNDNVPKPYRNMDRFAARKKAVADLEAQGYLVKTEKHSNNVGVCYRCHTVIEPYLSDQWFVKMKPLAEPALKAVQGGLIRFYPERWVKVYEHWMTNIRDWCISRQLWWGHRIPVYYSNDGRYTAARDEQEARKRLRLPADTPLRQDEDVLDTWFSSWLWPFSVHNWPDDNRDLRYFNPTDTLVTAPDIIFFWVARMAMANLEFMKDLPLPDGSPRKEMKDLIPFRNVYFTSTVRNEQGKKMSKSLGNAIDPMDVIHEYGADALRFTITYLAPLGQDVYFSSEKCEIGRNFANKIWNAGRFLLMNRNEIGATLPAELPAGHSDLADLWIVSRLNHAVRDFDQALEGFRINEATKIAYDFVWHDFCDWYVEFLKTRLYGDEAKDVKLAALERALWIFDNALRLLHPMMPFVTEELWQHLADRTGASIMLQPFPQWRSNLIDEHAESDMEFVQNVINGIRTIRGENTIPPAQEIELQYRFASNRHAQIAETYQLYVKKLCKVKSFSILAPNEKPKLSAASVVEGTEILISLEGLIDPGTERARLEKEIARLEGMMRGIDAKLSNESFTAKAPTDIVAREREKRATFAANVAKLKENLARLI